MRQLLHAEVTILYENIRCVCLCLLKRQWCRPNSPTQVYIFQVSKWRQWSDGRTRAPFKVQMASKKNFYNAWCEVDVLLLQTTLHLYNFQYLRWGSQVENINASRSAFIHLYFLGMRVSIFSRHFSGFLRNWLQASKLIHFFKLCIINFQKALCL